VITSGNVAIVVSAIMVPSSSTTQMAVVCKLPIVLSVEEVADVLAAVPGPGLKYRAALGISYGAGLRASEV
jgi:site-specific recombinase XerD